MRRIRAKTKKSLKKFNALKSLDDDTKRRLRAPVRHYEIQLAAAEVWSDSIMRVVLIFVTSLALSGALVSPYLFIKFAVKPTGSYSIFKPPDFISYGMLVWGLALFILFLPEFVTDKFSRKAQTYAAISKLSFGWTGAVALAYGIWVSQLLLAARHAQLILFDQSIGIGLTGVLGFLVTAAPVVSLGVWVRTLLERRTSEVYPYAVVVDGFLGILWEVEDRPSRWAEVDFKRQLITQLEKVAFCIDRYLPRRLRTGDMATDGWLEESSEQIAAGVRDLVKWVFTPKRDTREQFISRIALSFEYAARGEWDNFERVPPEKLSRPEILRTRIRTIFGALLSAAVPVLLLLLLKNLKIVVEPILTYLTVGAYVWAALTFLARLDPDYAAKLTAIKDISQLLPLPRRDNK
jgi:hypothetical protein